jgi:SagB-type dehydrogenase family enzyme
MASEQIEVQKNISLPEIVISGDSSVSALLQQRRSVREYRDVPLSLRDLGRLLWAAQGITHPQGYRTAPSAGALYPLELYVAVGRVEGLTEGVYHYDPDKHQLNMIAPGDQREAIARAALGQSWIADAAAVVAFTAVYARTARKYGGRSERYVHIEVGHAAQSLFLQAEELGVGTVDVGAFNDNDVARLLQLPADTEPVLLMPVGKR